MMKITPLKTCPAGQPWESPSREGHAHSRLCHSPASREPVGQANRKDLSNLCSMSSNEMVQEQECRTPQRAYPAAKVDSVSFRRSFLPDEGHVLVINPGSTSTKFGVFSRSGPRWVSSVPHSDEELEQFRGRSVLLQAEYRAGRIASEVVAAGFDVGRFVAVAGRGGLLPPLPCGTYLVDDAMVEELRRAPRGEHASNLGALLALHFARAAGVSAYIVDPVTVDEWQPCARFTGSPLIERTAIGHALNTKAVIRRYARDSGRLGLDLRLIVIHLGSGITVSAHRNGRMIDNNTPEEGPFGPDRSGSLPVRELIKLCCGGTVSQKQLDRKVFGEGGLFAYLGTRDLEQVERRIDDGDAQRGRRLRGHDLSDRQGGGCHGCGAAGPGGRAAADRWHGPFRATGGPAALLH